MHTQTMYTNTPIMQNSNKAAKHLLDENLQALKMGLGADREGF